MTNLFTKTSKFKSRCHSIKEMVSWQKEGGGGGGWFLVKSGVRSDGERPLSKLVQLFFKYFLRVLQ